MDIRKYVLKSILKLMIEISVKYKYNMSINNLCIMVKI